MARLSFVFLTAVLLATASIATAQQAELGLLGQIASLYSSDTTIDASQATYEGTGLVFNSDGTVGVILNGIPILTIPGLNLLANAPSQPLPPMPPSSGSKAVDVQIAATDLPGVISALESLGGANTGRKLKM